MDLLEKAYNGTSGMTLDEMASLDMNDGTHSRHDEAHYRTCQPCLEDHLDFMQECDMDGLADEDDNEC